MQRVPYVKQRQGGFAILAVLFLVSFLAIIAQGIIYIVRQQATSQQQYIRHRQVAALGIDLMLKTLTREDKSEVESGLLPEISLYPGAEKIAPKIIVENREALPLRSLRVLIEYKDAIWQMQNLKLGPPGSVTHVIYNNHISSSKEIVGQLPEGILAAEGLGFNILPRLDIQGYLQYKSMPLPSSTAFSDLGLVSRLYANNSGVSSGSYVIKANTKICGNGVLYHGNPITIEEGCTSSGKLWLICNDKIIIGDNVKLEHAFIFANGPISIGRNVSICGIIVSAGVIELGEGFAMRGDKSVLDTFSTSCYMN